MSTSEPDDQGVRILAGRWRNERGSEMILCQKGRSLSGEYITSIGDGQSVGQALPLIGMAHGTLVGFVVCWPDSSSLTTWAGRIVRDESATESKGWHLHTVWHLVRECSGDPPRETEVWDSFITYTSIFSKISAD